MASFPHQRFAGSISSFIKLLAISLVTVFTVVLVGPISPAQASDDLAVSITSISSADVPNQSSPAAQNLVLKGNVTGLAANQAAGLKLKLSLSGQMRTRSAISDALADPTSVTTQSTVKTDTVQFAVSPGSDGSATWSVQFTTTDVMQETGNGVYAFGVTASAGDTTSDTSTTLFPWFPDGTSLDPTALSLVIPLTAVNTSSGSFHPASDDDRSELDRISQLVSIEKSAAAHISWVIDPSLNEWLASVDDDQARTLTEKIAQLAGTRMSLPYGLANVDALAQSDLTPELNDLVEVTDAQSKSVYLTTSEKFDLTSFTRNKVSENFVPVLPNVDFGVSANSTLASNVTVNGEQVLSYDQAASDCLALSKAGSLAMTQCVTGHVAMMTAEQPNRSRNVTVLAPINWSCDTASLTYLVNALSDKSWVASSSLATFLKADSAKSVSYTHSPEVQIIPAKNVKVTRALTTKADALAEVIDNPAFVRTYKQLVARTFSTQWSNQATAYQFAKTNVKNLQALADSIAIKTSPSITIGSESAELPITVVNSSGYDVTVRVALTSNSPARFKPQTSDDISIKDGQKITVTIPIKLYGAGRLSVSAALVSTHGKVVGSAQSIGITPTAYTRFASTIVIGALGVLILLVAFRLIRRRLRDRKVAS